jgi:trehalose-phosphatase
MTDLDGTIAPLAGRPADAVVSPACRRHLEAIARRAALVAVVSGRAVEDVRRLVGLEGVVYVGLHGFSLPMPPVWDEALMVTYTDLARGVLDELRRSLTLPGVVFEDKGPLLAFHYRPAADAGDPAAVRQAILEAIAAVPAASEFGIHEGKMFVELRPPYHLVNKGSVLLRLAEKHALRSVVCLGDDVTDADPFEVLHQARFDDDIRAWRGEPPLRGASVVAASDETPAWVLGVADYQVQGVDGIEWLLSEVARALGA